MEEISSNSSKVFGHLVIKLSSQDNSVNQPTSAKEQETTLMRKTSDSTIKKISSANKVFTVVKVNEKEMSPSIGEPVKGTDSVDSSANCEAKADSVLTSSVYDDSLPDSPATSPPSTTLSPNLTVPLLCVDENINERKVRQPEENMRKESLNPTISVEQWTDSELNLNNENLSQQNDTQ